ncbi:hypothetical protein scyTo_0016907 [Scyliorhinus torazame]|uniref:CUB domain-containing protein n=1 Tax=Scyliorhinus torazame TaxID=75743 RepID=A0A401Q106_SCYTO|nr:hypothetical protein [Scyliorhinus torazame]
MELSNNCSKDLVTVQDSWTESNQSVKLCGLSPPPPVFSNSTAMMVQFHSDDGQDLKGFRAVISFIDVSAGDHEDEVQRTVGTSVAASLSNQNTPPFSETQLLQVKEPDNQDHHAGVFDESPVATDPFGNLMEKVHFPTSYKDVLLKGNQERSSRPVTLTS